MTDNLHETTKKIKQSLRLSMNGIVSAHQRRQGLNYRINFGVEIPRIKEIAREYEKSEELATALWQENIRECKLLAIFLLPQECYATLATKWVAEAPFTEIADHLAMNILCKLPEAAAKALQWCNAAANDGLHKYCGFLTLTHLARQGLTLTTEQEEQFYKLVAELFETSEAGIARQSAAKAICSYIDEDKERAARLLAGYTEESAIAAFINDYIQAFQETV